MKNFKIEAAILAIGLALLGTVLKNGIDNVAFKDRFVSVKGLAEKEVMADKVVWPIAYKDVGNDMVALYNNIQNKNKAIVGFLKSKGVQNAEIDIASPQVLDLQADRYNNNRSPYRYNVTSVITVTSKDVKKVRQIMSQQLELLRQGIAIASGSDYQYNPVYSFRGLNSLKPKMIEEATKNARAVADKFANDSGSRLGKIQSASQGQFSIDDRDANTPYIKEIRVVTTVNYYLKN
jgi:Uncharacterized protein conserved in bacteria